MKNKIYIEFNSDLFKEAEGCGWNGWFCPVWATIKKDAYDKGEDLMEFSLGDPVSKGTTFVNEDGHIAPSWVGNVECWNRKYSEEDAEIWAEDTGCDPEDFDCDLEFENEVDYNPYFDDLAKEITQSAIEYALYLGYKKENIKY